jgi:hypothetical protein
MSDFKRHSVDFLAPDFDPSSLSRRLSKDLGRRLSKSTVERLSKDFGRRLSTDLGRRLCNDRSYKEEAVKTSRGMVTVAWKGKRENPALVTYHDIGLNHVANFQAKSFVCFVRDR